MKNMKVSGKLIVSFLVVIVLTVIVGAVGIFGMFQLNKAQSDLYSSNLRAIQAMGEIRTLFNAERNDIRNIFLNQDNPAFDLNGAINKFTMEYNAAAEESFALYEKTIGDITEETAYFTARDYYVGQYTTMKTEMFSLFGEGRFEEAYALFVNNANVILPILNGFEESAGKNDQWAHEADESGNVLFGTLTIVLIIVLVVAITTALVLALYISGLISKPLKALTGFMNQAGSTGDIALRPEDIKIINTYSGYKDETGQCIGSTATFVKHITTIVEKLGAISDGDLTTEVELLSGRDTMGIAMKKMADNLNRMFGEIQSSTAQVATGSKQIADGAQSLAQGSTEQASAIEELSASIGEIAGKTKQNADIAKEAADLSGTIRDSAEKGSAQMDQMMQAVKEINEASNQIGKVIKVIDDIAFQTNILALNAAVEAARAGQHGKGFAVVAEEVRNLAAKSAEAAKDTGGLIENSIEKANFGLNIATETSVSLKEIVGGINRSAEIVAQIARSSDEQAGAIIQINTGIDQVAQVVQQNSATAEESAAASEEMSGQSDMLEQLISQFKLKDSDFQPSRSLDSVSRKKELVMPQENTFALAGHAGEYGKY